MRYDAVKAGRIVRKIKEDINLFKATRNLNAKNGDAKAATETSERIRNLESRLLTAEKYKYQADIEYGFFLDEDAF